MEHDLAKGNFFEVLKLHNKYGELWLKGSRRIDTVYNLGKAFELAGAYKEADVLFRETFNLLASAQNSDQAIEHSVFEHLPTYDQVHLRLARVKSEMEESGKAYDYLREIKNPTQLSEAEQIERMEIAVKLLKARGEVETAKTYLRDLIDNWKGQPLKVVGPRLNLAEIDLSTKDYSKAEASLKQNLSDLEDAQKVPSEEHLKSLQLLSDVHLQANNPKENIRIIDEMLRSYPDNESLNSYRFRLGKLHFGLGNIQKATEIWKVLEQKKADFWWGLARNHLKDSEWKDTYQKYIKRIPAMDSRTTEEKGSN